MGHLAAITRSRSSCSSPHASGTRRVSANLVGEPRSAAVKLHSTSIWPTSQPLCFAYISIVTAVHEARLAANSSCGHGPSFSPPASVGSSTTKWWPRISTSCASPCWVMRRAVAFISGPQLLRIPSRSIVAPPLLRIDEWVEQQPRGHLGKEVGGLRRHTLAAGGNILDV